MHAESVWVCHFGHTSRDGGLAWGKIANVWMDAFSSACEHAKNSGFIFTGVSFRNGGLSVWPKQKVLSSVIQPTLLDVDFNASIANLRKALDEEWFEGF